MAKPPDISAKSSAAAKSFGKTDAVGDAPRRQLSTEPPRLGKVLRVGISLAVVLHLLAVFAEPYRFFSQSSVKPGSEEALWLRRSLAPYVEFMYLSHGYSFFAPNPGPSHLLLATFGTPSANGDYHPYLTTSTQRVMPDRQHDRPRLLYHRYFMLAEFYHNLFAPKALADLEQLEPALRTRWEEDLRLYQKLQASIEGNLLRTKPEQKLQLRRIEHALPSEYQVLGEGWKLTDPRLYLELPEGELGP
jgi:hypothetical protein